MRFQFILIFLAFSFVGFTQIDKLKIKKEDYSIYFFQQGKKSDTVSTTSNNIFVLKIGVSRRCNTIIEIENGRLVPAKADSVYKLVFMPNMNYRHRYRDSLVVSDTPKTKSPKLKTKTSVCSDFKTEINGSNNSGQTKVINIRFISMSGDSLYLANKYYYR